MKTSYFFVIFFISLNTLADREVLWQNASSQQKEEKSSQEVSKKPLNIDKKPTVLIKKHEKKQSIFTPLVEPAPVFVAWSGVEERTIAKVGDMFDIHVLHSVLAFPDEKSPILAEISSGPIKGSRLIGFSSLEKNSKRILIEFSKITVGENTYTIKASGLSALGDTGIYGEHHSQEGSIFAGEFIATFVASYFDNQIPRTNNPIYGIQEDKSVDSSLKKGLASGAMSTANSLNEKLKKVPEFSEYKGPFSAKVIFLEIGNRN
jgi:hypothetical protein